MGISYIDKSNIYHLSDIILEHLRSAFPECFENCKRKETIEFILSNHDKYFNGLRAWSTVNVDEESLYIFNAINILIRDDNI